MIIDNKIIAFTALLAVQVFVSIVYKTSQTKGKYTYSPLSVIASAEFIKLCMSMIALSFQLELTTNINTNSLSQRITSRLNACRLLVIKEVNTSFILLTCGLASLYLINNQLAFVLFLFVDIASISMFKSLSTFVSAILLWAFFQRQITREQWASIILQVIGLCIVQYDGCQNVPILAWKYYLLLIGSTCITAISSVSNERLIKTYAVNIHIQNAILYSFGFVFNLVLFIFLPDLFIASGSTRKGYFDGYSLSVLAIIVCNSLLGIVITFVYKYADAIVKTFSTACATGVLLYISIAVFHLKWNLNVLLGAIVIFVSSYLFLIVQPKLSTTPAIEFETEKLVDADVKKKKTQVEPRKWKRHLMIVVVVVLLTAFSLCATLFRYGSIVKFTNDFTRRTQIIRVDHICVGYPVLIHGRNLCSNGTRNSTEVVINSHVCQPIEYCSDTMISCYLHESLRRGYVSNKTVSVHFSRVKEDNRTRTTLINTTISYTKILSHWEKNNIALVIHFNSPRYERLPLFDLYHDLFPLVVFTGPKNHSQIIECPEGAGGNRAYECLSRVIVLHPNYAGYLMVHFDLLPILYTMEKLNLSSIWTADIRCFEEPTTKKTGWGGWDISGGRKAITNVLDELRNNSHNTTHHARYLSNYREHAGKNFCVSFSDIFYLPKRFTADWLVLGEISGRHNMFLEVGFACMTYMLIHGNQSSNMEVLAGINFGRGFTVNTLLGNPSLHYLHYINLREVQEQQLISFVIQRSFPKRSNATGGILRL